MKYQKIVVVGPGLIGGSIGKALLEKGLSSEVVGICRRGSSAAKALEEKAVTSAVVENYAESCAGADIVVIATPVDAVKGVIDELARCVAGSRTVVTDAGSTKKDIVDHASKYADNMFFVGAHPMAGSENSGVENSTPELFEGSVCLVTPVKGTCPEAKKKITSFWEDLGATVKEMAPEEHDIGVAFSSHLPHVAAYALAGVLEENLPHYLFAGSFRDTTRVASSNADLWSQIFEANRENVLKAVETYRARLEMLGDDIRRGKKQRLLARLNKWKGLRDEIFREDKSGSDRRPRG